MNIGNLKINIGGRSGGGSSGPDGAPSGLTLVVKNSTTFAISFSSTSTNQDGYRAYLSTGGIFTEKTTNTNTTFDLTGLNINISYFIYVVAYKGTRESTASNTVESVAGAPFALSLTAKSTTEIDLIWESTTIDFDAYRIYISTNGTTFTEKGTSLIASYPATSLTANTLYYFKAVAYKGTIESFATNVASISTHNTDMVAGWTFDSLQSDEIYANTLADYSNHMLNQYSAVYYNNKTYITYQGSGTNDDPYILTYNHTTGLFSASVNIGVNPLANYDRHGAPCMFIDQNGYIHVAWGAHNSSIQYSVSTNPEDITAWTAQASPATGSYPQFIEFSDHSIYMFFRKTPPSPKAQYGYIKSTDNGFTWGAYVNVFERFAYGRFMKGIGDTVHCSMNGWDTTQYARFNVYYMLFDGTNWKNAAGTNQTLPVTYTGNAIEVYNSGIHWIPMQCNCNDVSNNPYILFTEGAAETEFDTYTWKLAKYSSGAWHIYNLGVTTNSYEDYATAMEFEDTTLVAYITTGGHAAAHGGAIERWTSPDYGETWAKEQDVKTSDGTLLQQYCFPIIIKDHRNSAKVVFAQQKYSSSSWSDRGYVWGDSGLLKNIAFPIAVYDKLATNIALPYGSPTFVAGQYGNCANLVGASSQRFEVADADILSFVTGTTDLPFTVTFWFQVTATSGTQYLFCKGYAANREWEATIATNVLNWRVLIKAGTSYLNASTAWTTVNEWHFCCMNYDGSKVKEGLKIYIDCVDTVATQAKTGTYTNMTNSGGNLFLGSYGTPNNYMTGKLDEFKIFNKVLSPSEMTLVMNNDPKW
jgi:hypothetical protein